jgi:serine protease Do
MFPNGRGLFQERAQQGITNTEDYHVKSSRYKIALASFALTGALTVSALTLRGTDATIPFSAKPAYAYAANGSVADVVEKVMPSVVNIFTTRKAKASDRSKMHPFFREYFRNRRQAPPKGGSALGSGVIISADGIVLTNNHVVKEADKIWVRLHDKRKVEAKIIGTDPKSDLAVLRIKNAKELRPLAFGDSARMRLGDAVLAIGNPFGVGQTVTMGIVSAKGRANVGIVDYEDFIQTDAAINPGNSGGALVNLRGELVGINTAILSRSGGYQGIGFAIPSNMAKPIMTSLINNGKVVRGWLGVVIQETTEELAKALKLPHTRGVVISDVDDTGPAKKGGIKRGDLVTEVNGQPVHSPGKLRNAIASAGAHASVSVSLIRKGKSKTITLKLAELPADLGGSGSTPTDTKMGLKLDKLTPSARKQYDISRRVRGGLVITKVSHHSAAAQVGLRSGDVILELNRVTINTVRRFNQLYSQARGRVLLLVYRKGITNYLFLPKD